MAAVQVRALYDFSGEPGTGELTITAGDVLTVVRQDVGEGWWEGCNARGEVGLFPAAYVEEMGHEPPPMPPPPLPEGYSEPASEWGVQSDPWSQEWNQQQNQQQQNQQQQQQQQQAGGLASATNCAYGGNTNQNYDGADDWDDDWDDDSEVAGPVSDQGNLGMPSYVPRSGSTGDVSMTGKAGDNKSTVRRNINRFSTFVKSGGESYILGTLKVNVPEQQKVEIIETPEGSMWAPNPNPYSCGITSPKKESKLKGLKSFIAYQITPTFNNIQVSRRYKHFDWLHERLEGKFTLIPIPPLPDKQISGRYEEHFIERRKSQLQSFVDHVCRHPVLSRCEVWQHFLTCTDDKRWKMGKRQAEKDELVGANYFLAIQVPERPLDLPKVEQQTETFGKFVHGMDNAVRNLQATVTDQVKKYQGVYKREYQKIGQSFRMLGQSFESDTDTTPPNFIAAVKYTGDTYEDIGRLFEEQPRVDWEPLGDVLHDYKGMLASFPEILQVHKGAMQKRRECEKLSGDNRMGINQVSDMSRKTDVISYALLAEINYFQTERVNDFRTAMQQYLQGQVAFYQQIVDKLQVALDQYN